MSVILVSHATGRTPKSQHLAYASLGVKPAQSALLMIHTIMYTCGHVRVDMYVWACMPENINMSI